LNETQHDIHNRATVATDKCIWTYKGSPTSSQNVVNFSPQTASNWTCIFTHLRKFCIVLHRQALHTEIRTQKQTKLCQPADSKSREHPIVEKSGSSLPKFGAKKLLFGISTTSRLNGGYLLNETGRRQSWRAFKSTRGPLRRPKIAWTLVHKRLKVEPDFYPHP